MGPDSGSVEGNCEGTQILVHFITALDSAVPVQNYWYCLY